MSSDSHTQEWLPLLATVALFLAVVYATYTSVSQTWADLVGLVYLLASPAVYAAAKALVRETPGLASDAEVSAS